MSNNENHESSEASKPSITFDVFEAYYKANPDMDNAEYYSQFPTVNQGTIRSWKSKARNTASEPIPDQQSTPTKTALTDAIEAYKQLTRINPKLLEGLSEQAQLNILKNQAALMKNQGSQGGDPNINIIPTPSRSTQRKLGIEQYISYDPQRRMVKMTIPASVAHDPKLNKKLGEYIEY